MWREFEHPASGVDNAIIFVKSNDGGQTFSNPQTIRLINPYDRSDQYETGGFARDCGDGPFLCVSNFVFHRQAAFPQAVVDAAGNVYVTWEEVVPVQDNGDTYHPDGQARVVVTKSTNGGGTWSNPVPIDPQASGHQWWPNLEYDRETGTLVAIYFDSRADPFYSPNRPPGNKADGTSSCGVPAPQLCNVLNTFLATSTDGLSWSPIQVSTVGHQPEYEMFGDRDVPFHGDYLWVDANGGTVFGVWVDNRAVVPGQDPRAAAQDGFDVLQCRAQQPDGSFGPDTCPNAGGLNQNIYGGGLSLP